MSKLKIKLYNEGNVVIFRVLEQCEGLRAHAYEDLRFESSDGFKVRSLTHPTLGRGEIFLRGTDENEDNRVCVLSMRDEMTALQFISDALFALQEWKESGYFEGKKESANEEGVYEF